MLAAARGEEAWVTGDGRARVTELIDAQINSDLRRGLNEDYPLNMIRIEYDPAVALELERQGLSGESVPADGRRVLIQRNGNVAFDCTDEVHPETAAIVVWAARCVGLDIAGIDLVAEDISLPLGPQGGAIVEVNAGPGLIMHLRPAAGLPRPVGRAIVDYLFPDGADGRIPVVGISGTRGKTRVARILDEILNRAGRRVGLACSDGLFVERRPLAGGDCAHWGPAQRLLINPEVEVAIIENGPEAMLREGLAYDRCQVGVITNIDPTQIPADGYVDSSERLCVLLRTQVDVVLPTGLAVLNAADPLVAAMAPLCDGEVILFAADPAEILLAAHRGDGGRAVSVVAGQAVLLGTGAADAVADLDGLGWVGADAGQVDNLLAAIAAAWALGLTAEAIREGVASFTLT